MDEKRAAKLRTLANRRSLPRRRFLLISFLTLLSLYTLLSWKPCSWDKLRVNTVGPDSSPASSTGAANVSHQVQLEAHIMSKCPDARDCLRDLVVPAMEKVSALVDFRLSFIGS